MTTQADIAAIERLLEKKQAVPSQLIRSLLMTVKVLMVLNAKQSKEIAELKAVEPEKAEA